MATSIAFKESDGFRYHGGAVAYALLMYALGWVGLFSASWFVNLLATLALAHGTVRFSLGPVLISKEGIRITE